jgi:serine/threonine protein kinase
LTESELAASLEHPAVMPIYDAGEVDGQLFLVMRLVEGRDLKALLRAEGRLEPERALAIVAQVAEALDAGHAKGLGCQRPVSDRTHSHPNGHPRRPLVGSSNAKDDAPGAGDGRDGAVGADGGKRRTGR